MDARIDFSPPGRGTTPPRPVSAAAATGSPGCGRRASTAHSRRRGGFSLIELLLVLAAMAILATVAYPSYTAYKVRANRAAAQSFLMDLSNREQQYFLGARAYAGSLAALGITGVPAEVAAYYTIDEPVVDNAASPPRFMLSAVARTQTIQARDGDLAIDSSGARSGHW